MDFSFFPFEECQNARTGYEFLEFLTDGGPKIPHRLPLARFAHGVLICRLVGFTNSFTAEQRNHERRFMKGGKLGEQKCGRADEPR